MDIKQAYIAQDWAYDRPLLACRFSPNGQTIATSSEDSMLQRWNTSNGEKVILKGHESWVHALRFSVDGSQLISGGCEGRLIWWPIQDADPKPLRSVEAHQGWIRAIDLSPDGTKLVSVGNDLMIRIWSMATGE